jgi:hypothetical protein
MIASCRSSWIARRFARSDHRRVLQFERRELVQGGEAARDHSNPQLDLLFQLRQVGVEVSDALVLLHVCSDAAQLLDRRESTKPGAVPSAADQKSDGYG